MTREAPEKRCANQDWALMTSTHPDDHIIAKKFCADCPALQWCQTFAAQCLADPAYGLGVEGTWAGVLYRDGRVVTNMERRGRRAIVA